MGAYVSSSKHQLHFSQRCLPFGHLQTRTRPQFTHSYDS